MARRLIVDGEIFGQYKVLRELEIEDRVYYKRQFEVECSNGKKHVLFYSALAYGANQEAYCPRCLQISNDKHSEKVTDAIIAKHRYQNWVVLELRERFSFLCRCDCGRERVIARTCFAGGTFPRCECLPPKRKAYKKHIHTGCHPIEGPLSGELRAIRYVNRERKREADALEKAKAKAKRK